MSKSRLKVKIFGTEYTLKADTSPEYIKETAGYVDSVMKDVESRFTDQSDARIAVLAALNIAEELFQLRQEVPVDFQKRTKKITDILASALSD